MAYEGYSTLTPSEQQVMDLYDEGLSIQKIAVRLGMTEHRAGCIVSMFDASGHSERTYRTTMAASNAAFLERLHSARPFGEARHACE